MSFWLFVIGEGNALEWIVAHDQVAFRNLRRASQIDRGDRFALYLTQGAYHNPVRDQSQILGTGVVATVAAARSAKS